MAFETLLYTVDRGVATITLNRQEKLNAFTIAMCDEIIASIDKVDADDDVRAVVITGAGRAFCAGADLSAGSETFNRPRDAEGSSAAEAGRDAGGRVTLRLFEYLKPMIAAVNGAAVGVGATMQLAMDIRLMSTEARYGFVFVRRGIVPEAASSWFLPRIVGLPKSLEWCLTGRMILPDEALAAGLVRSVHAPDALLPAAYALAREIADNAAPVSVALTRHMLWRLSSARDPMEAHRIDSRAIRSRGASADAREGVRSFLEKRTAQYSDKVSADLPDLFPWWAEEPFT